MTIIFLNWLIFEARKEIQKYFRWFLVQMKSLEFAFEINWPLVPLQIWFALRWFQPQILTCFVKVPLWFGSKIWGQILLHLCHLMTSCFPCSRFWLKRVFNFIATFIATYILKSTTSFICQSFPTCISSVFL